LRVSAKGLKARGKKGREPAEKKKGRWPEENFLRATLGKKTATKRGLFHEPEKSAKA